MEHTPSFYLKNRRILIGGVAAAMIFIVTVTSLALAYLHRQTELRTAAYTQNLASSMELTFEGLIDTVDIALMNSADEISGQQTGNTAAITRYLNQQTERLSHISAIRAANADGKVIYGPGVMSPPHSNADRDYFIYLRDHPKAGLFISQPVIGRIDKRWIWMFARRITLPDGSFGGVVFAVLNIDEINKILAKMPIGPGDSITLRDTRLHLVARNAVQSEKTIPIGSQSISKPFEAALQSNPKLGSYTSGRSSIDDISRIHTYRQSPKYGFTINVGASVKTAFSDWYKLAGFAIALLLAFTLAAIAFIRTITRLWQRQKRDTAELETRQQMLLDSESRLRDSILSSPDPIMVYAGDGEVLMLSKAWTTMSGYDLKTTPDIRSWAYQADPTQSGMLQAYFDRQSTPDASQGELSIKTASGEIRLWHFQSQMLQNLPDGRQVILTRARDVTEVKKVESDLRIAATAFEAKEGMLVTDSTGRILRANPAFCRITGYSEDEVIGKNPRIFSSGRHDADFYAAMWSSINHTGSWEGEIWNRRKNGEIYPEHITITAVYSPDGTIANYVGTIADITANKLAENKIQHLAFFDPLTRLPNRRLLMDRLRHALSVRDKKYGALLFIDLDNFKILNDTLGHDIGDILLQQVADRLTSCVRDGDTVARLGGDEFIVMLSELSGNAIEAGAQTERVGEKILAALNQSFLLKSHHCHSTPSIGAVLFNDGHQSIDELLKQADIAMYQAKSAGRNTVRFFDSSMQDAINDRASLEGELRKALEEGQFRLYYQIQVDSENLVHGAETLIRWIHPELGLVSPARFIPLAEETGLILPIGQWVMDTACAQLKTWQESPATCDLILSVNVSAKQFRQPDFAIQVQKTLSRHAINPSRLKLELTESLLLDSIEDFIATMNTLNALGIQFSLDDFGTGYSSLQYLKRLPLDQLKIDQSFVRDICTDSNDRAIVQTIIAMAHNLGLDVIAEGVETEQQRQILLEKGCTNYQGYLFGKPMSIEQFETLLADKSAL